MCGREVAVVSGREVALNTVPGTGGNRALTTTGVGRVGEEVAAAFLSERGYHVLARNKRTPFGEVDLLCSEGSCLVVVEVKARGSATHGEALEAIGQAKAKRLRLATAWWLGQQQEFRPASVRFDAVLVALDEHGHPSFVQHVKDLLGG